MHICMKEPDGGKINKQGIACLQWPLYGVWFFLEIMLQIRMRSSWEAGRGGGPSLGLQGHRQGQLPGSLGAPSSPGQEGGLRQLWAHPTQKLAPPEVGGNISRKHSLREATVLGLSLARFPEFSHHRYLMESSRKSREVTA